jgi:MerR family transcriptional regulator, light-induced transcriptional regulator
MNFDSIITRYMNSLLNGDRVGCRAILGEALQTGTPVNAVYTELFWPIMAEIEMLHRDHRINDITVNIATRINRTLVDQLQSKLPRRDSRYKKMVISCANGEPEELGAQMCADLFESDGWEVKFLGGGIPEDEIVEFVGIEQPDVYFIYGTKPSGAPGVRKMIDRIRDIGACPDMRIMLSGGVFNRAEGLWEEIGADLFAATAKEALKIAMSDRKADQDSKKRRKKTPVDVLQEVVQSM